MAIESTIDKNCATSWSNKEIDDGYQYTAPVGSYPSGVIPYGALDMAGNVWEWTADWYDSNYYETALSRNPTEPESGASRVLRGGSWLNAPEYMRATDRHEFNSDEKDYSVGVLLVRHETEREN